MEGGILRSVEVGRVALVGMGTVVISPWIRQKLKNLAVLSLMVLHHCDISFVV